MRARAVDDLRNSSAFRHGFARNFGQLSGFDAVWIIFCILRMSHKLCGLLGACRESQVIHEQSYATEVTQLKNNSMGDAHAAASLDLLPISPS